MNKYFLLVSFALVQCSQVQKEQVQSFDSTGVEPSAKAEVVRDTALLDELLLLNSDVEIAKRFGNKFIHIREASPEVEETWPVTHLFPDSKNQVAFEWVDTLNFDSVYSVTIRGKQSDWKTKSGVKLGTTLDELEKLNDKPFLFYNFGWNFGGEVDWDGGKLSNMNLYVQLSPEGEHNDDLYDSDSDKIPSNSEAAKKSNLKVISITLKK